MQDHGNIRPEEKSPGRRYDSVPNLGGTANLMRPALQRAFTERMHELTTLDRLVRADLLVSIEERKKFAVELQNYHRCPTDKLAAFLDSSLTAGLNADTAERRLHENGRNVIAPPRGLPLWVRFLLCFVSGFAPLLWVAAGVVFLSWKPFGSGASGTYNLCLAVVLLIVIFISGLFQFHQEVITTRALAGFGMLVPPDCIVIRDGVPKRIPAECLVIGDIVTIESGGRVPADLRIFEAMQLRVDKSMLTGESEPVFSAADAVPKDSTASMLEAANMVFTGCCVTEGQGRGMVVATGTDSQLSKIAAQATAGGGSRRTTLQAEISRFVFIIASFASVTAVAVIVWWALFLNAKHKGFMTWESLIANAISVLVAFVPEGLPLALSMGLAIIARRLCVSYNVLLKQMGTVETLGSMSLLASDKTGTLTQNKMAVVQLIALDAAAVVKIQGATTRGGGDDGGAGADAAANGVTPGPLLDAAFCVSALCNQAVIEKTAGRSRASTGNETVAFKEDGELDVEAPTPVPELDGSQLGGGGDGGGGNNERELPGPFRIVGSNGIDKALLQWACESGVGFTLRAEHKIEAFLPFSSATKTAYTVVRRRPAEGAAAPAAMEPAFVLAKGAPEYILAACATALDGSGATGRMTPAIAEAVADAAEQAAGQGQRIVGLARRALPLDAFPAGFPFAANQTPNFPTDGLEFVGCVAVSDPPRGGVFNAVGELRNAGIKIAMVTGDAPSTALAIARQTGVVSAATVDSLDAFTKPDAASAGGAPTTSRAAVGAIFSASFKSSHRVPAVVGGGGGGGGGIGGGAAGASVSRAVLVLGAELEKLSAAGWSFIFEHEEMVFARTTPEQKLQIVKESQSRGHRVGVTGDGVNDAPALRRSDVGVAMYSGADTAKDAAAIVLLTDDFAAIVHAVREGRLIFANLRKVIAYQISAGCWSELLPVLATFFFGMPQPLSTFLMIMISCFTDVFSGVALMNEPAETAIMKEPPRDFKRARLVDAKLVGYAYLFYANLVSVGAFLNYFIYMENRGPTGVVPDPVPADGSGFTDADFPAGYVPSQLIFAWNWGIAEGPLGDDATAASNTGSAVFFIAIAVGQLLHHLSVRQKAPYYANAILDLSDDGAFNVGGGSAGVAARLWMAIKQTRPLKRVLLAWAGAVIIMVGLTEIPALQTLCGTGSVPPLNWGIAFGWSALCFMIAEARKWIITLHPNSLIGKSAW